MTEPSSLYLVRLPIDTNALASWAGDRGWIQHPYRGSSFDHGRALHHLLNESLGPALLRPFRLLVPPRRNTGFLYAYSNRSAEDLSDIAQFQALPDHLAVLQVDTMQSKTMPGRWRPDQRIGFDIRVRPVRRLTREFTTANGRVLTRGAELDAFLLEALNNHPGDPRGMSKEGRTRETVYLDWLAERLGSVAALVHSTTRLIRFQRAQAARRQGVDGPDAIIQGTMDITDPANFNALLKRGIGRHCAYGYGMLLLRPPNTAAPPP